MVGWKDADPGVAGRRGRGAWAAVRRRRASPGGIGRRGERCHELYRGGGRGTQIPEVEDGKFNVAMVLIGPHDDGGWSQAHYEGLQYVEKNVPNVHTAYIENVPEGADSEQVIRSLARKGFKLIYHHLVRLYGSDRRRGRGVPRHHVHPPHRLQDQQHELRQPLRRDGET